MSSKEKCEVDEVPYSRASETVESKDLEESLDASKTETSVVEDPREEFVTAGKLSDLALTNLLNNAIDCLKSDVKIKQRSAAFRELAKAVKVLEDFDCSQNEDSVSSVEIMERVAKKTEMLKILAAMSELSMIDAASVAAKYTMQYDLALRERNSLISSIETENSRGKKCENQTKVQFVPGLKDHDDQSDSKRESKQTAVKCEKSSPSETGRKVSGSATFSGSSEASEPVSGSFEAAKPVSGSSEAAEPVSGSSEAAEPVPGSSEAAEPVPGSSEAAEPVSGSSEEAEPVSGSSEAAEPVSGSSEAAEPVSGSSEAAEPVSGSSEAAEPVSGSSEAAEPVSGSSEAAEPVSEASDTAELLSGASDVGQDEPVTNPADAIDLLTATSGIGEQSLEVSEIEPSSEASEIEPSVASETGEQLGPSEFERQTSATTQTSECSDFAAMPVLSSGQESSAVESDVLESCSELSRAEPAAASAAVPSANQEFSRTHTVSSSTKKKQTDLEGFIFLHLAIEYIALAEKERNNDIDAILAVLFKVEDDLKKKIDKQVLRTFKVLFDDVGEGILKFKNVGSVQSASSYFSESTFSESFLPSHDWSLAGTSASSIQTDSPHPGTQLGESGRTSELQSSGGSSARQSRQSSISESQGLAQDLSRSRSESLDRHQRPPEKRVRANSPNEGYPFVDGEKSFEFQGTPLSLDVKVDQETSVPPEEGETEVEESKSDLQEEKSSGYHEDSSKKS